MQYPHPRKSDGFTLVELLVVVAIIALLIGIALPALNLVGGSANKIAAQAQQEGIAAAILAYQSDFRKLPGYLSENEINDSPLSGNWTGTENLVLALIGQTTDNTGEQIGSTGKYFDKDKIGDGPRTDSGRRYDAYYTPKTNELIFITDSSDTGVGDPDFPELVDPQSGMPILYLRASGKDDKPVGTDKDDDATFWRESFDAYLSKTLKNQDGDQFDQQAKSLIGGSTSDANANNNLAWFVTNPTLSDYADANDGANGADDVAAGSFVLISAGKDGIYFDKEEYNGGSDTLNSKSAADTFLSSSDEVIKVGG